MIDQRCKCLCLSAGSEAAGLGAVCGHGCAVPAAAGGRLERSVPV